MTLWGALTCARCGMGRRAGLHGSVRECRAIMRAYGGDCIAPSEHHRYRSAILTLAWWGL